MKRKLVLSIGFVSVLALSIVFAKDFPNAKVYAQTNGDQYRFVSVEEQNWSEAMLAEGKTEQVTNGDKYTFISAEEQNMVENSSAQQGFVPQENGTGFYFVRVK
ncbi:hypothetical protein [Gottfriedia acidiceleris]|uniref:Uncharacterized protein n=1 Tax=Gottfriedia acidiceleris TaxID=371036 RepID=A0ABY4JQJ1_9BACI|nr:hypothetical protein [Gottfriedia acidiceleris]UPM56097.1 hypothetical protein MY490_09790 [Gottfriedia acidiceleris]